jgi:hypothetical protein
MATMVRFSVRVFDPTARPCGRATGRSRQLPGKWYALPLLLLLGAAVLSDCGGSPGVGPAADEAGRPGQATEGGASASGVSDHAGGRRTVSASGGSAPVQANGGTSGTGSHAAGAGGDTGGGSTSGAGGESFTTGGAAPEPGAIDCRHDGDDTTTLVFVNRCTREVTFAGSDIGGGSLAPGEFQCVDIGNATDAISSKRYWGYAGEDPGAGRYTLAEFTFNTDFNDFDWYDISHVDAFNLPIQISPASRPECKTLTCAENLLADCPEVGQYRNARSEVVACVNSERDNGDSPVALYFESCDDAYAWSADDQNGDDPSPMRACAGEDWDIVFCPQG